MQDFPAAEELLEAVAAYLFGEVREQVPRGERFKVLVAANVCAVVARELRAGEEPSEADAALFAELTGSGAGQEARAAAEQLASAIRSGDLDGDLDLLISRLPEHVRRKLDVARPGYAD